MDDADFNFIADDNVIEADTVDCAEVTMEAMDVETAQSLEGKPVDMVKPDQSWMQRRPLDDRQEDLDNDTPVPGSNSVKVESEDLVSKGQDDLVKTLGELVSKVINLTDRVNTLEDQVNKFTTSAASLPNHGSSASASQPKEDTLAATSASGTSHNKRKSAPQYKAPRFAPWPMDSGKCRKCKHYWAQMIPQITSW